MFLEIISSLNNYRLWNDKITFVLILTMTIASTAVQVSVVVSVHFMISSESGRRNTDINCIKTVKVYREIYIINSSQYPSRNMKDQSSSNVWLKDLIEDKIDLPESWNPYLNLKWKNAICKRRFALINRVMFENTRKPCSHFRAGRAFRIIWKLRYHMKWQDRR